MGWVAALPPGQQTRYLLYRKLCGPQGRSGRVREGSPAPLFNPRTFQPITSRYTNCAIPTHRPIRSNIYSNRWSTLNAGTLQYTSQPGPQKAAQNQTDSRNVWFLTALLLKIQIFREITSTFRSMHLSQTWTLALRPHRLPTVQNVTLSHNCHFSLPAATRPHMWRSAVCAMPIRQRSRQEVTGGNDQAQ